MVDSKAGKDDDSDANSAPQVDESLPNESELKEPQEPSLGDEESVSEDTSDAEPADIDEELRKVGITGNDEED